MMILFRCGDGWWAPSLLVRLGRRWWVLFMTWPPKLVRLKTVRFTEFYAWTFLVFMSVKALAGSGLSKFDALVMLSFAVLRAVLWALERAQDRIPATRSMPEYSAPPVFPTLTGDGPLQPSRSAVDPVLPVSTPGSTRD